MAIVALLLNQEQFQGTFSEPMQRLAPDDATHIELRSYVESINASDYQGHDCSSCDVSHVYRDASGRFEHVLIDSENKNVFMVIVIDRERHLVYGHHLLDLRREYGLAT